MLWSTDSRSFFVNGNANAYSGDETVTYLLDGHTLRAIHPLQAIQADMLRRFPPCYHRTTDIHRCGEHDGDRQDNMVGIAWTHGSHGLVVWAEVPCNSEHGDVQCQVRGYEIAMPSGKILRTMSASEFKTRYQFAMAWTMTVPPVWTPDTSGTQ